MAFCNNPSMALLNKRAGQLIISLAQLALDLTPLNALSSNPPLNKHPSALSKRPNKLICEEPPNGHSGSRSPCPSTTLTSYNHLAEE